MYNGTIRSSEVLNASPSGVVLLLAMSLAGLANAADPPQPASSAGSDPSDPGATHEQPAASDALPDAVDLGTLEEQRGREGISYTQLGLIDAQIDMQDNEVNGATSGDNLLGQGVFDGADGISTVIQNTGHNVAIQESLVINIAVNP